MKCALLYFYDPAQSGSAEGEVSDWLALDAEIEEAGAHEYGPVSIRRAPLGR